MVIPEACPGNYLSVPPTLCSFSGGTLPTSTVIQGWPAQWASYDSCSGPWHSRMVSRFFFYCCLPCLCPEKDLMPVVRTGSVLCLFCISHIWLFLDFLFQKVIPSFLQLQTVSQFPRWSFVPLLFTKETGEAMLANFFLTAYCSRPGPQFALCLWKEFHRPIEPSFEGSIPSKVVRWSGTTRTWRLSYVLWGHRALLIGKEIWYGLNTLTILSLSLPQSIGINPHCFQSRRRR